MRSPTHALSTTCHLLAGILVTTATAFSIPLPQREAPEATTNITTEKFNQIRTTYFDVAGNQNNPTDGMEKLSEVFPPNSSLSGVKESITSETACTPPSQLSSPEHHALYKAYCASFVAFEARNSLWPLNKLNLANRSLTLLDSAVTSAPESLEVRALRLAVTHHLPFFFERSDQAADDLNWLTERIDQCRNRRSEAEYGCGTDKRVAKLLEFVR
jgi:hypothetical protein